MGAGAPAVLPSLPVGTNCYNGSWRAPGAVGYQHWAHLHPHGLVSAYPAGGATPLTRSAVARFLPVPRTRPPCPLRTPFLSALLRVINSIQTSDLRNLFNPENVFISKEGGGAGNNWASGYTQGEAVQETLLDMMGEGHMGGGMRGGKRGCQGAASGKCGVAGFGKVKGGGEGVRKAKEPLEVPGM